MLKNLHYTVEVVYPKDESRLIDSYTEAVYNIIKNKLSTYNIEELIFLFKNTPTKKII